MTEKMIRDAYVKIRTIDQTIPDEVLDFMKEASIEKLNRINSLPNDKKIEEKAFQRKPNSKNLDDNIARNNWIWGAQWMRSLVLGKEAEVQ